MPASFAFQSATGDVANVAQIADVGVLPFDIAGRLIVADMGLEQSGIEAQAVPATGA